MSDEVPLPTATDITCSSLRESVSRHLGSVSASDLQIELEGGVSVADALRVFQLFDAMNLQPVMRSATDEEFDFLISTIVSASDRFRWGDPHAQPSKLETLALAAFVAILRAEQHVAPSVLIASQDGYTMSIHPASDNEHGWGTVPDVPLATHCNLCKDADTSSSLALPAYLFHLCVIACKKCAEREACGLIMPPAAHRRRGVCITCYKTNVPMDHDLCAACQAEPYLAHQLAILSGPPPPPPAPVVRVPSAMPDALPLPTSIMFDPVLMAEVDAILSIDFRRFDPAIDYNLGSKDDPFAVHTEQEDKANQGEQEGHAEEDAAERCRLEMEAARMRHSVEKEMAEVLLRAEEEKLLRRAEEEKLLRRAEEEARQQAEKEELQRAAEEERIRAEEEERQRARAKEMLRMLAEQEAEQRRVRDEAARLAQEEKLHAEEQARVAREREEARVAKEREEARILHEQRQRAEEQARRAREEALQMEEQARIAQQEATLRKTQNAATLKRNAEVDDGPRKRSPSSAQLLLVPELPVDAPVPTWIHQMSPDFDTIAELCTEEFAQSGFVNQSWAYAHGQLASLRRRLAAAGTDASIRAGPVWLSAYVPTITSIVQFLDVRSMDGDAELMGRLSIMATLCSRATKH